MMYNEIVDKSAYRKITGGGKLNSQILSDKIDECKLSRNAIAEELGLTRQGLYNKLYGIREFKGSEIKKLIQMLGLTEQEQQAIFFADDVGENANSTANH